MKKYAFLAIILMLSGCGMFEGTKEDLAEDVKFDNPMTEANRKEALYEAREDVNKARRQYNKCLEENNNSESACSQEKEAYEKTTERYMEIQK